MNKISKKILTFVIGLGCCISTQANASYYENNCYNPCESSFCPTTFYLEADYLYWKARVDDMPFVFTNATVVGTTGEPNKVKDVDWTFNSGFRIGGGALFGCNDWDLSLLYTRYRSHSTGFFNDPTGESNAMFIFFNVGVATADQKLRFQTLDLSLKKDFCLCNGFLLAPKFGLLFADIKDNNFLTAIDNTGTFLGFSENVQKFWAVGPKIGANVALNLFSGLSFVVETSLSLLWSDYKIKRFDFIAEADLIFDANQTSNSLRLVPQYLIGIQWDAGVCFNKYHVKFLAAWEEQLWIHYNQLIYGETERELFVLNRNSDLNLYGLTLRGQLGF